MGIINLKNGSNTDVTVKEIDNILNAAKEENKAAETQETKNDKKVQEEEKTVESTVSGIEKKEETKVVQNINWFDQAKQELELEHKDVGSFKEFLQKARQAGEYEKRIGEYETKLKETEELRQKYNELREASDPVKFFGSTEKYKQHLIKKKYEGAVNDSALDRLLRSDVGKMSGMDKLLLSIQLNTPGFRGGDKAARQQLFEELNLDEDSDLNNIDDITHNKLQGRVVKADKNLREILNIEVPKVTDFEEVKRQQAEAMAARLKALEESWQPVEDKLINDLNELKLEIDGDKIDFKIDDAYKVEARAMLKEYFKRSGKEPNEKTAKEGLNWVLNTYKAKKMPEILVQYKRDLLAVVSDKAHEEFDNPRKGKQSANVPEKEMTDHQKLIADVDKSLNLTNNSIIKLRKK